MKDLSGVSTGRLLIIKRLDDGGWLCECRCGNTVVFLRKDIERGTAQSCGCYHRFTVEQEGITCLSKHPIRVAWVGMHSRCYNPKASGYGYYGGRGIVISLDWFEYSAFLRDMEPTWFPGASLDRIDPNGNYTRENCEWATTKMQGNNRRTAIRITLQGETKCLKEWCQLFGIKYQTTYNKIRHERDLGEALLKEVRRRKCH